MRKIFTETWYLDTKLEDDIIQEYFFKYHGHISLTRNGIVFVSYTDGSIEVGTDNDNTFIKITYIDDEKAKTNFQLYANHILEYYQYSIDNKQQKEQEVEAVEET